MCTATHCNILQHTATRCKTLHYALHCNTLQHTATHCNTLQHTATHCNTLQHTATHCNTLLHTAHTATHHRAASLLNVRPEPSWKRSRHLQRAVCTKGQVLQCVAACYIVLRGVAFVQLSSACWLRERLGVLQCIAACCSMLLHIFGCCILAFTCGVFATRRARCLQCVAACCILLQCCYYV